MTLGTYMQVNGHAYLTGRVFGRLLVTKCLEKKGGAWYWECKCSCGSTHVAAATNLMRGQVKSCGCLYDERAADRVFQNGYAFVKCPDHPRANPNTGRVREHILVMEKKLGRLLFPGEEVHHKNSLRADNDPDNLELWVKSQPAGARVEDLVAWAKQILERYDEK